MKLTKGAIGNLVSRYSSILKKCNILNFSIYILISSISFTSDACIAGENERIVNEGTYEINMSSEKKIYENYIYKENGGVIENRGILTINGEYTEKDNKDTYSIKFINNKIVRTKEEAYSSGFNTGYGAAIYNNSSQSKSLTVDKVLFECNISDIYGNMSYGAAISGTSGYIDIKNCYFYGNIVKSVEEPDKTKSTQYGNRGSAIYTQSEGMSIDNCIFDNNYSINNYTDGGAVHISSQAGKELSYYIKNSSFLCNTGNAGAAIDLTAAAGASSNVYIVNNIFKNNVSSGGGGAIYLYTNCKATLDEGSTFDSNTATGGGAIRVNSAEDTLLVKGNSGESNPELYYKYVFSNNIAYDYTEGLDAKGGGIYNKGKITFEETTSSSFINNSAQSYGGAIYSKSGKFILNGVNTFSSNTVAKYKDFNYIFKGYENEKVKDIDLKGDKYLVKGNIGYGGAICNVGSSVFELKGVNTFDSNSAGDIENNFIGYGGAIYNEATFTITGTSQFGTSENVLNSMVINKSETLEKIYNDIYNIGTINIGDENNTQTKVTLNSGYIGTNNSILNVKSNANLYLGSESENSGTIEISTNGNIEIQKDATLYLKSESTNTITGTVDIKTGGTLDVDSHINSNTNSGTIINNGIIDMATKDNEGGYISTGVIYSTIKLKNLTGNGELTIDVDISDNNGKAKNCDKIEIITGSSTDSIILSGINVVNSRSITSETLEKYVVFSNIEQNGLTYRLVQGSTEGKYTATDGTNDYIFTLSKDSNGNTGTIGALDLVVKEATKITLPDFIQGREGVSVSEFQMAQDIKLEDSLGKTGNVAGERTDTKLSVVFNSHTLTGTGSDIEGNGVTVADGFTLKLTGSGTMTGFSTAVTVEKGGTAELENISFSGNGTDIKNSGTTTLDSIASSTTVVNDGTLNLGGGEFSKEITGSGTTNVQGTVTGNAKITNKVSVSSSTGVFTINASNLGNTVDNRGTLNLTGGTLSQEVSGAGQANVTADLTNSASLTNAVAVSSGVKLTNTANGKIVGVLTIADTASVSSDASSLQGKVENSGSLELGSGTMQYDVSGTGTTSITGVVTNAGTNANSLTVTAEGSLANTGVLSGTVTNDGTLASQVSDLTGDVTNNGIFLMSGNLSKDIKGSGTTTLASSISMVEGNASISGTLNMNGASVEMRDKSESLNVLTVGSLTGTGSLSIDVDMSDGSSDKITISSGASNKATVKVASINVTKDGKAGSQEDFVTYLSGALDGIFCQLGEDGSLVTVTDGYKYTFTLGSLGKLNMEAEDGVEADLSSFITDLGDMSGVTTFSFGKDLTVYEALGRTSSSSGRGGELTIALNGYSLQSGNACDGLVVGTGYTLNLNGPEGNVSGFGTAIEVEQGAILNVSGVTFKDNKTDIENSGELNLTGTNTVSVVNDGTLQLAGDNTLVNLSGSGAAVNTGKVTVGASGLGNPLVNSNELILKDGTLSNKVSGSGSVEIQGNVEVAANVTLTASSTKLPSGTLTVNGSAELGSVDFSGAGSLVLAGTSTVVADRSGFLDDKYASEVGSRVVGTSGALNLDLGGAIYTAADYEKAKGALFGSDEKAALNFLNGNLRIDTGDNLAVGGEVKESSSSSGNTVTITKAPVVTSDGTTTEDAALVLSSVSDKYVQVVKESQAMDSSSDNHQTNLDTINIKSKEGETLSFASKGLEVAAGTRQVTLNVSNATVAFTGGEDSVQSVVVMDGKQETVVTDIVIDAKARLDFGINGNKAEQKGSVRNVTVNGEHNIEGNGFKDTDFTYTNLSIASLEGSTATSGVKSASLHATTVTVTSDGTDGGTAAASVAAASSLDSSTVLVQGTGTSFAVKELSDVNAEVVSVLDGGQVSLVGASSLGSTDIVVQGAEASLDVKDSSTVETDSLSVSNGGAVNVISATLKVKDGGLRIGQGGVLFLDPVHFDAGSLADDNTLSGGLYVGDGTVALVGADDSFRNALYNRLIEEDSPVSVTGNLEDYTVASGQTVLALGSPMKMAAGAKLIVDATVKADGSISGDTLPSGSSYVYFGDSSLLAVDGSKITKDAAISAATGTTAKIAGNAKLYIANAVSGTSYYILAVDSIEGNTGWMDDNLLVDTDLLGASFHYSGANQGWVKVEGKTDAYPGLDGELVKLLSNLADNKLIDTESDTMGIRFLSRATASEASGKYMAGDKKGAVKAIESSARIAMAGAVPQMSVMASESLTDAIGNRMNIANGMNAIQEQQFTHSFALWITPLWKNQSGFGMEGCNQNYGFNANIGGVALGADWSFSENWKAGLAFNIGGGYSESSGDLSKTTNNMNFWGLGIYGGYNDGTLSVMGDASYTSTYNKLEQDLDQRMQMRDLKADVRAAVWSLGIRGDYKLAFDTIDVTPHLGVHYTNISSQEYDIEGGGTVAKSDGISQTIWSVPVGVTFAKDFTTAGGWSLTPSVDVTVTPRLGDLKAYESIRYTGVPGDAGLRTQTRDYITYKGTAGIGAKYGSIGLGLNYSYEGGSCTSGHGVNASFRWEF